jgi:hypothetical protein
MDRSWLILIISLPTKMPPDVCAFGGRLKLWVAVCCAMEFIYCHIGWSLGFSGSGRRSQSLCNAHILLLDSENQNQQSLFKRCSIVLMILLSWVYMSFGQVPEVAGVLYGIKPAVTAIALFAAHRIGSRALKNGVLWTLAALAFFAIFAMHAPFSLIVLFAALLGAIGGSIAPQKFAVGGRHGATKHSFGPALIDDDTPIPEHARFRWAHLLKIAAAGLFLWGGMMGACAGNTAGMVR